MILVVVFDNTKFVGAHPISVRSNTRFHVLVVWGYEVLVERGRLWALSATHLDDAKSCNEVFHFQPGAPRLVVSDIACATTSAVEQHRLL